MANIFCQPVNVLLFGVWKVRKFVFETIIVQTVKIYPSVRNIFSAFNTWKINHIYLPKLQQILLQTIIIKALKDISQVAFIVWGNAKRR